MVKDIVSETTGINISSKKRTQPYVDARTLYYRIIKDIWPKATLQFIGKTVNRDHSTVIHGLSIYDEMEERNPVFSDVRRNIALYLEEQRIADIPNDVDVAHLKKQLLHAKGEISMLKRGMTVNGMPKILVDIAMIYNSSDEIKKESLIEKLTAFHKMNR